jgi:hypothetical protein
LSVTRAATLISHAMTSEGHGVFCCRLDFESLGKTRQWGTKSLFKRSRLSESGPPGAVATGHRGCRPQTLAAPRTGDEDRISVSPARSMIRCPAYLPNDQDPRRHCWCKPQDRDGRHKDRDDSEPSDHRLRQPTIWGWTGLLTVALPRRVEQCGRIPHGMKTVSPFLLRLRGSLMRQRIVELAPLGGARQNLDG